MSSNDDEGVPLANRLIMNIRQRVILVRARFLAERAQGSVSHQTISELRETTIEYYEALREFRSEPVIEDEWEESRVDELEALMEETTTIEESKPGHGSSSQTKRVPAIQQADPMLLVEFTRALDDLCKQLGFSATVRQSTPRTEIDDELMEDIEEWRQTNQQ